jgi:hypothetical protein
MGDGASERTGRRLLRLDVDPLMVVGGVGEGINPILGDLEPVTDPDLGVDQVLKGSCIHSLCTPSRIRDALH